MSEAVDNNDVVAEPTTEESVAPAEGLDELLNQFDSETKVEQPKTEDVTDNQMVVDYIKNQQAEKAESEVNLVVDTIAGEIGENVSKRVVKALLMDKAQTDQRVLDAYTNRGSNPSGWNKVMKGLANEFSSEFQNTSDTDAVVSAVHSASITQPIPETAPDVAGMSDSDFFAMKAKLSRR